MTSWLDRFVRSERPIESVDLAAPELFDDPYPIYSRLRREAPIVPVRSGGYLLSRHADIRALLTHEDFGNHPSRFSALHPRFREARVAADLASNILPFLDPPEHTEQRRLLAAALREGLRDFDREIDELAGRHAASAGDSCDALGDLAGPYTRAVMCRLLGMPERDGDRLAELTDHFFRLFAPLTDADLLEEVNRGLAEFRALVDARRRTAPKGSLLRLMEDAEIDGVRLTPGQIADSAILIFSDGVENVAAGVATALLTADRIEEAGRALSNGGEDAAHAVGETLRLDSPAQVIPRIAQRDTEVMGQPIGEGMPLFLALGSANRDESVFESADRFELHRNRSAVMTFGAGRHFCLGAGLAESQIAAMATAVWARGFRVDAPDDRLRYRRRAGHRWLESLPLRRTKG